MAGVLTCACPATPHALRRIVLTGGPGAGKTAVLELVARSFCPHVRVLPESASILFGGGFPRRAEAPFRRASQRAIFHVQQELERAHEDEGDALLLCDRGTVDGVAYWPGDPDAFWRELGTTRRAQLARYHAVIHLRVPTERAGYRRAGTRIESAEQAAEIDARLLRAWEDHPQRFVIDSSPVFLDKAQAALARVSALLPPCCAPRESAAAARAAG